MRYLLIIFFFQTSLLQSQALSQLYITESLISSCLNDFYDNLKTNSIQKINPRIYTEDELLRTLIINRLLDKFTLGDSSTISKLDLDIVVNEFEVCFPEVVSFPLFGEERIKRVISLGMSFILSESGNVLITHKSKATHTDTVNISSLKNETGKSYQYEKLPKIPFIRHILEPAIITAVTGSIVYLFFVARSK